MGARLFHQNVFYKKASYRMRAAKTSACARAAGLRSHLEMQFLWARAQQERDLSVSSWFLHYRQQAAQKTKIKRLIGGFGIVNINQGALNGARQAPEKYYGLPVLAGDGDVVDAASALAADCLARGCEGVPLEGGGDIGDIAVVRHCPLVVGVTGERKAGISQGEQITAMANFVPIDHGVLDGHA